MRCSSVFYCEKQALFKGRKELAKGLGTKTGLMQAREPSVTTGGASLCSYRCRVWQHLIKIKTGLHSWKKTESKPSKCLFNSMVCGQKRSLEDASKYLQSQGTKTKEHLEHMENTFRRQWDGLNENSNLPERLELCAQETKEGKPRVRELKGQEKNA